MICANCGQNWLSGSGEEVKNVKSLQRLTDGQTDGATNNRRSGELKKANTII
jgi:hypothetical protein